MGKFSHNFYSGWHDRLLFHCKLKTQRIQIMHSFKLGQPFSNVISYNEGFEGESTGIPYFFVTNLDQSMQDIIAHNFTSFSISEFQTKYCEREDLDPEDPRCARLVLSGSWSRVPHGTTEYSKAKEVKIVGISVLFRAL